MDTQSTAIELRVASDEHILTGDLTPEEQALLDDCYIGTDPGLVGLDADSPCTTPVASRQREFIDRLSALVDTNRRGPALTENRDEFQHALDTWGLPDLARLASANARHPRLCGRVLLAARERIGAAPLAFNAWREAARCQDPVYDEAMRLAAPEWDGEWPDSTALVAHRVWRLACLAEEVFDDECTRATLRAAALIGAMSGLDMGGSMILYLGLVDGGIGYQTGMEIYAGVA